MAIELKLVGDSGQYHRPHPLGSREEWRLEIRKDAEALAAFSLDDLAEIEPDPYSAELEIECVSAGFIAGKGRSLRFGGIRLSRLLEHLLRAGIPGELQTVKLISMAPGACGPKDAAHWTALPLRVCLADENRVLLATSLEGKPLPYEHGGPLRIVVGPTLYFYKSLKWLRQIDIVAQPVEACRGTWEEYAGYHNAGWADGNRFEPRMRLIRKVIRDESGRLWDESDLVPPERHLETLKSLIETRNFSRLIAARLHEIEGVALPKDYSSFVFCDGDFRAKLRGTSFASCKFHGVRFEGCNFSLSYFPNAEFSRRGSEAATFVGCDFEGAQLQNAWLAGVSMKKCLFAGAVFTSRLDRPSERVSRLNIEEPDKLDPETIAWLEQNGATVS